MSLYGSIDTNIESLKRWVNSLSVDTIEKIDVGGEEFYLDDATKVILKSQLKVFSKAIQEMNDGDDWRNYQGILSPMCYNAFIRLDNSSIKMGDFYECLIVPSNIKTYKKIIKGFDYLDIGAIHIRDNQGKPIASIGQKSDLIRMVFYEYFVNENEDGSIDHVYSNPEEYMSIQLINIENLNADELNTRVNEILLRVSMEYDMDFKVFEVNSLIKTEGTSPIYNMEYNPTGFEQIPMLYLSNAINVNDERLSYLSYYQVIEYFFVRAQNYFFLNQLNGIDVNNIDHNEFRKVLRKYKKINNEREALRLVLNKAVNISKLKAWISSNQDYFEKYCNSQDFKIDISKEDNKIISNLVERVYSYRCSIAHAKGDVEEYMAVPFLSREKITAELPLLRYLAFEVISECSEL